MLAPVAVVPLGLRLIPLAGRRARQLLLVARLLQPVGAVLVIASFIVPAGPWAALLAAGWFAVCSIAGLAGASELVESRSLAPGHLLPAAALGFLAVGAAWLIAARGGISLGYSGPTVELTAVHFHYAGFGTPVTATGIATGTAALTVIGPLLLATGILTNAALTAFLIAPRRRTAGARWLLAISSAAVVIPMLLGVDYAVARVLPVPALDLRTMAIVHGDLNAVLYSLIGLAGWSMA